MSKEVIFKIKRFDGKNFFWEEYKVPFKKGMTVLEALFYIKGHFDSTLSFRASCRMGVCGSCAMVINGKARLACETQVAFLGDYITVEPLKNFTVIKDLVTDFKGFFAKHKKIKPYLIRKSRGEIRQTPAELKEYYLYTLCLKCGACVSACPVAKHSLGPMAIVAAYRFNKDSRDEGKQERLEILKREIWNCHFVTECSEVCPKNIEPAKVVQKLRLETLKYILGF